MSTGRERIASTLYLGAYLLFFPIWAMIDVWRNRDVTVGAVLCDLVDEAKHCISLWWDTVRP